MVFHFKKNNRLKELITSDNSCEEIFNSKVLLILLSQEEKMD